jgi:exopolysaccharide biosynthesis polyprenyl glycosylphosphotransferase
MNATAAHVDVEAQASRSRARGSSIRSRLVGVSLAADVLVWLLSYELALVLFSWVHDSRLDLLPSSFDWSLIVGLLCVASTFLWLGLYKLEVYVSRPLHLITIAKGTLIAMVITAFFAFAAKAPLVNESRLVVFGEFFMYAVLIALVRTLFLDRLYRQDVLERHGTLVIGENAALSHIAGRCQDLRGFAPVVTVEPADRRRNGYDADPALLDAVYRASPAPRQVFLDGGTLGHKAVFDLIEAARARGAEVYVSGRLVGPLDSTRLLLRLFEMPVMRVRGVPAPGHKPRAWKRAFDVLCAALLLVVLSPVFAVIAVLIRRDSPGPVFYKQTRVGLGGRHFEFLKFRSMRADNDAGQHREYVQQLISCGSDDGVDPSLCTTDEYGRPVYKLAEDDRVTKVGRVLRKYSLDELPQFWNVLKGDMSMVGPRPALDYEVAAYKPWHRRRLELTPGVSGLWQIAGRSRVGFDEMVFQDTIYAYNLSLLTDVNICLRTAPAMLVGRGAV